jgi:hypothetical protein
MRECMYVCIGQIGVGCVMNEQRDYGDDVHRLFSLYRAEMRV